MKTGHLIPWLSLILCAALVALTALPAAAEDKYWLPTTGDWAEPANWDPAGLPTSADDAYIDNGGTAMVASSAAARYTYIGYNATGTVSHTGGTHKVGQRLFLGYNSDSTGVYDLQEGQLTVDYAAFIGCGSNATGRFTQMGGAHHSISLYLGGSSGSTGIYNLQGGELLVYGPDVIGMFGSFTQTGGIHIAQYELILGLVGSSTGVYDLEGGVLSVASEYLGSDGTGSFTQTGGTHSVYGSLYLGDMWSGASGIYDLQEGQLTVRQSEYVGRSGTGSFSQTGGTHDVLYLTLGSGSQATGVYELHDGELAVTYDEYVGYEGTGSFTQTGGTHSTSCLYLGRRSGSTGAYDLQNGGLIVGGTEYVGYDGTGEFTQSGGTHKAGYVFITGAGRYELGGGVFDIAQYGLKVQPGGVLDLVGGNAEVYASGIVDFSEGDLLNTGAASLSGRANSLIIFPAGSDLQTVFASYASEGLTHVAGTTLTVPAGGGFAGGGQLSDFVDCQGTVGDSASDIDLLGGVFVSGTGQMNVGGGTLRVDAGDSGISGGRLSTTFTYVGCDGTGTFTQTGGTHSVGENLRLGYESGSTGMYKLHDGELTVGGREYIGQSGIGTFTQTGGTHTIAGNLIIGSIFHPVTGIYNLLGGVLSVNTIFAGSGGMLNFTGGTLHADEVECFLINDGGVLAPGMSIGTTTCSGYYQNAGTLEIELGSLSEFDRLDVYGVWTTLGGTLSLLSFENYRPKEGDSFAIISAGGGFVDDFSEVLSDIVDGIPEGLEAFSTAINGTAYEVVFNGYSAGDADGDHSASLGDLCIMAGNWNQSGKTWAEGDFNGDGKVSIGDLCMLAGNWNWELPGSAPIPEPATLLLLAFGGLALLRRRS